MRPVALAAHKVLTAFSTPLPRPAAAALSLRPSSFSNPHRDRCPTRSSWPVSTTSFRMASTGSSTTPNAYTNGAPDLDMARYLPHRSDPAVPASGPGNDWVGPILDHWLDDAKNFVPPGAKLTHPLRVLVLYGTLRPQGFSKMLAYECARLLEGMGAEVRVFDPNGLPVRDPAIQDHEKVVELRSLVHWSEAQVWSAAELHGNLCSVFKNQIDWIPLNTGSVRPTQGKSVAVLQVNGGSQSFNVVNTLRLLARWMRMQCVTNQSSVAMAWKEFDDDGRMKKSSMRERVVDVMEEMIKFGLVNREYADFFTDRFSERKEKEEKGRLMSQAEKEKEKEAARIKAKANE